MSKLLYEGTGMNLHRDAGCIVWNNAILREAKRVKSCYRIKIDGHNPSEDKSLQQMYLTLDPNSAIELIRQLVSAILDSGVEDEKRLLKIEPESLLGSIR